MGEVLIKTVMVAVVCTIPVAIYAAVQAHANEKKEKEDKRAKQ